MLLLRKKAQWLRFTVDVAKKCCKKITISMTNVYVLQLTGNRIEQNILSKKRIGEWLPFSMGKYHFF